MIKAVYGLEFIMLFVSLSINFRTFNNNQNLITPRIMASRISYVNHLCVMWKPKNVKKFRIFNSCIKWHVVIFTFRYTVFDFNKNLYPNLTNFFRFKPSLFISHRILPNQTNYYKAKQIFLYLKNSFCSI